MLGAHLLKKKNVLIVRLLQERRNVTKQKCSILFWTSNKKSEINMRFDKNKLLYIRVKTNYSISTTFVVNLIAF